MTIRKVCVFCASSPHVPQIYLDEAYHLGELLAGRGVGLITGGGSRGLMASVEDGALSQNGGVTAIIPRFMVDAGWLHKGIRDVRLTEDMAERKRLMLQEADAIIVLPGGCGTMDEAMEALTLKQLGFLTAPILIVNVNGFYDMLAGQLQRMSDECFIDAGLEGLWNLADNAGQAVDMLSELPEWDTARAKLSLRR